LLGAGLPFCHEKLGPARAKRSQTSRHCLTVKLENKSLKIARFLKNKPPIHDF
jgi:hypothetical protein